MSVFWLAKAALHYGQRDVVNIDCLIRLNWLWKGLLNPNHSQWPSIINDIITTNVASFLVKDTDIYALTVSCNFAVGSGAKLFFQRTPIDAAFN